MGGAVGFTAEAASLAAAEADARASRGEDLHEQLNELLRSRAIRVELRVVRCDHQGG